jgi:type II secretory pathway component PulC
MMRVKKQKPRTTGKLVSVLVGCAAATVSLYQPIALTTSQSQDLLGPEEKQLSPTRDTNDVNGIFGFSFRFTNTSQACIRSGENLTGIVTKENNTLFIIEGATGIRLYRLTERIDGKYPIVAYDATHVIIRKSGSNTLLCLEKRNDAVPTSTTSVFKTKPIITPYFSLIPVSGPEQTTIGYVIRNCSARCKIALSATGLRSDDVLIAINNRRLASETWQQLQENAKKGNAIVVTVKRASNTGNIDIPIPHGDSLKQLLVSDH